MNDNSVKKDIWLVIGSIIGFYAVLLGASWVDLKLDLAQAYTLADIACVSLKVATASALAWILKRLVFTNTLGKDFGKSFNEGWADMSLVEKARWTIGTFLVVFTTIMWTK